VAIAELNDPRYGRYEGGPLDAYLEWAHAHGSRDVPPGDGETRNALAARYATGFRKVLERPERTVLVVAHSLPLAYVLMAVSGRDPAAKADLVEHAKPYRLTRDEVERAVERVEAWCGDPTW
jgi:broad specificity phosphatase PhoE